MGYSRVGRSAISTAAVGAIIVIIVIAAGAGVYFLSIQSGTTSSTGSSTTSSSSSSSTGLKNLTLTLAIGGPASSIDPAKQLGADNFEIGAAYEPLLTMQPGTTTVAPNLATAWNVSLDGLTYTLTLRQGVKFHDGTAFNSSAVVVSFNRTMTIKQHQSSFLTGVKGVQALGPQTVQFSLKSADPGFLYILTSVETFPMVSPSGIKAHQVNASELAQGWLSTHDDGTGPYVITSFIPQTSFIAVAFPQYWKGWSGSHFTRIVGTMVGDPSTRKLLLTSGQVAMTNSLNTADADALSSQSNLNVQWVSLRSATYLMTDNSNRYLSQIAMRKAIAYAINYTAAIVACCGTHSLPGRGPLPSSSPGFNSSLVAPKQDLTLARQYLAQTNYTAAGSPTLTIAINQDIAWKLDMAQVIQQDLKQVGINTQIVQLSSPVVFKGITTPGSNAMYLWYQPMEVNDPISTLSFIFAGPLVVSPPSNPASDIQALLKQAAQYGNNVTAYYSILQHIQSVAVQKQYIVYMAEQTDNWVSVKSIVANGFQYYGGDYPFQTANYYAMVPGPAATGG